MTTTLDNPQSFYFLPEKSKIQSPIVRAYKKGTEAAVFMVHNAFTTELRSLC